MFLTIAAITVYAALTGAVLHWYTGKQARIVGVLLDIYGTETAALYIHFTDDLEDTWALELCLLFSPVLWIIWMFMPLRARQNFLHKQMRKRGDKYKRLSGYILDLEF